MAKPRIRSVDRPLASVFTGIRAVPYRDSEVASKTKNSGTSPLDPAPNPVAVFLGPTLDVEAARQILDADYHPPVQMGDIYRIVPRGVRVIVLIDGIFHGAASIWPREILFALRHGVHVLGASSMGALRATELDSFGVVGVGTVYQWYRDGIIDGDDEVALRHNPESLGYTPLSEPLVNIRATAQLAESTGVLSSEEHTRMIEYAKSVHYPDRSFSGLLEGPPCSDWSDSRRSDFVAWLADNRVNIKRLDAQAVLRECAERRDTLLSQRLVDEPKPRQVWAHRWEFMAVLHTHLPTPKGPIHSMAVLGRVFQDPGWLESLKKQVTQDHFILEWAARRDLRCPVDQAGSFSRTWRERHVAPAEHDWLYQNGLTAIQFDELLERRALIAWLIAQEPASFGLDWEYRDALPASREAQSRHGFLRAWAMDNGVTCPEEHTAGYDLAEWITETGPGYFGSLWNLKEAIFRELQITGEAARVAADLAGASDA